MSTKEKVHSMVDEIPEPTLQAIETLLEQVLRANYEHEIPIVEPVTDPDEIRLIDEGEEEYAKDPSSYVPFEDYLAGK
jgi:hypothetical protein